LSAVAEAVDQLNAQPPRTPKALNTIAAGQNPVNEAWSMFKPANAGSKYQYALT
jgi:hypothetical protein